MVSILPRHSQSAAQALWVVPTSGKLIQASLLSVACRSCRCDHGGVNTGTIIRRTKVTLSFAVSVYSSGPGPYCYNPLENKLETSRGVFRFPGPPRIPGAASSGNLCFVHVYAHALFSTPFPSCCKRREWRRLKQRRDPCGGWPRCMRNEKTQE